MSIYTDKKLSLEAFLELEEDGVYYTGHASIIVRVSGSNFLFDYVKDNAPYGDRWVFFPELVKDIPMDRIDGIFVSHVHQDHFDPVFLKGAEIRCPVYVIGGRPSFEVALKRNGIRSIEIPPGEKFLLAPGVYVWGFLHQSNGVDASCCIGNANFSVYHGNDNYLNNELLGSIDPEFSSIDVACIPYAYINWYPQLLENLTAAERADESRRLCHLYFEYAIEQAEKLNARQVIPFGANLVYKDDARSALNLECKTPLDFERYVRDTRGEAAALRFKALFSGDLIVKRNQALEVHSANRFDADAYRGQMQEFLETLGDRTIPSGAVGTTAPGVGMSRIRTVTTPTSYDHFICVRLEGREEGVMVNTRDSRVMPYDRDYLESNELHHHIVTIKDPGIYFGWLAGDLTMEEIIGTRRFSISRQPNIYNKDVLFIATTQL